MSRDVLLLPLHKWLLDMFHDQSLDETMKTVLSYPQLPIDGVSAKQHFPTLCRHFMAAICLVRLLSQGDPPQDEAGIQEAVRKATEAQVRAALSRRPSTSSCGSKDG